MGTLLSVHKSKKEATDLTYKILFEKLENLQTRVGVVVSALNKNLENIQITTNNLFPLSINAIKIKKMIHSHLHQFEKLGKKLSDYQNISLTNLKSLEIQVLKEIENSETVITYNENITKKVHILSKSKEFIALRRQMDLFTEETDSDKGGEDDFVEEENEFNLIDDNENSNYNKNFSAIKNSEIRKNAKKGINHIKLNQSAENLNIHKNVEKIINLRSKRKREEKANEEEEKVNYPVFEGAGDLN
jgi:hypothetical protein